jgi:outer membrane protein W
MKSLLIVFALALLACPVAEAGDSPWTLRFHGAVVRSSASRDATTTSGATYQVDLGASGGFGIGAEYRFSDGIGLEVSTLFAALELGANASARRSSFVESVEVSMMPLTLGVPFHFRPGRKTDIWVAPTVSYVTYHGIRYSARPWLAGTAVDVSSDTALGAAVGLDAGFGSQANWAFSTGLRYMRANAGGTEIDPLIVTIGFAYRF